MSALTLAVPLRGGRDTRTDHTSYALLQNAAIKKRKSFHSSAFLLGTDFSYASLPWQALNFLPLPQGQGSLRPTLTPMPKVWSCGSSGAAIGASSSSGATFGLKSACW